jgi:hypothetical protein
MSDSEIIWKFLEREFLDEHPVIYIYCKGNKRSSTTAITKISDITNPIFYPAMSDFLIRTVIKGFLENKKKQYIKGLIKIKPLYEF